MVAVILGIFEVVCIIRVVVNVLLILGEFENWYFHFIDNLMLNFVSAAKKPGEGVGHTLPWMIVTAICIVFGLLPIFVFPIFFALGIYSFIVINSYRFVPFNGHFIKYIS